MTHSEFINKYIGKSIDFDGAYNVQCIDGVRFYCNEIGSPIKSFGGSAWNGWVTGSPFDSTWKRVLKTPLNYPKEGDIIFWTEKRCKYGHVAIANKFCNPLTLRYLDENGTGKGDPYTNRFGTYKDVCGWMSRNI